MSEEKKYTLKDIEDILGRLGRPLSRSDDTYVHTDTLIAELKKPPITFADGEVFVDTGGPPMYRQAIDPITTRDACFRKLTQTEVGPDWRPAAAVDDLRDALEAASVSRSWDAGDYDAMQAEFCRLTGDAHKALEAYDSAIDPDKEA